MDPPRLKLYFADTLLLSQILENRRLENPVRDREAREKDNSSRERDPKEDVPRKWGQLPI
jgi:hypothetical protein